MKCRSFPKIETTVCLQCQSPRFPDESWRCCPTTPLASVFSSWALNPVARKLLHTIKYEKKYERLSLLKPFIPSSLPHLGSQMPVLIPVPLSINRFLERTFNQSEWLALTLAKNLKLKTDVKSLKKIRDTAAQSTLTRSARLNNLDNAFQWVNQGAPPQTVCLIDDVYTTGETLRSCAKALIQAGTKEVFGWTLFRKL